MLIGSLALLAVSATAAVVGIAYAVLELALRNYRLSAIGSLVCISAIPFVLIGHNLTTLATDLVAHN